MAVAGNLQDMSLPILMQSIIQDGGVARIQLQRDGEIGSLYIANGVLDHAELALANQLTEPRVGGGLSMSCWVGVMVNFA